MAVEKKTKFCAIESIDGSHNSESIAIAIQYSIETKGSMVTLEEISLTNIWPNNLHELIEIIFVSYFVTIKRNIYKDKILESEFRS